MASLKNPNALLAGGRLDDGGTPHPAIELYGVTRVFGTTPGLIRADLEVKAGETILIRGPNGAGKSTLLRVVATALSPTYGRGSIFGFDLVKDRDEIRRRTELVGHRTRLYEDLSARENLRFACALHGVESSGVDQALSTVGLEDVAHDRVRGFSQGMRQRVAVARALLRSSQLLLLDEPYAGLDEEGKDVVDRAISHARAGNRTVVLATHDPTRGRESASRTMFMDGGRLNVEPGAM